jgi:deferrochelatase/peroxidase EfeB
MTATPEQSADMADAEPSGGVNRRSFFRTMGVGVPSAAAASAVVGATTGAAAPPKAASVTEAAQRVPFHGPHQSGAIFVQSQQTLMLSYDCTAANRAELQDLFRTLTDRARFLMAGGMPTPEGISQTFSDSGTLGPIVPPDRLVVSVGVGSSLFDERYGLAARKPQKLVPMRTFPNDELDPAWCHGDISLQISANHADTALHALRDIARHTRGGMQVRWRLDGFTSPPRPNGVPRNHFGFMDGISNPDINDQGVAEKLIWADDADQSWTAGGSYLVVRLIRMLTEFWDRVPISEQERMIGRRRDDGAPLDANHYYDAPNYPADSLGAAIPLTAHMRLANPRTPTTAGSRIMRRGYNYDNGMDNVGNLDIGLIFTCYQRDPIAQFEATQKRLIDEPMVDYITPFGGGYFLLLPGARDAADHLGSGLFA